MQPKNYLLRAMIIEEVKPCRYLDITIDGRPAGRIVLELYKDIAPLACERFLSVFDRLPHTFFHRVIKNFVVQAGDVEHGSVAGDKYPPEGLGTGSIGEEYADENTIELDKPFLLCLANFGRKDSNGLQFFITTGPQPHLSGKHSVFGHLLHGKSIIRDIEKVKTTQEGVPEIPVEITSVGDWIEGELELPNFNACYDQIGGDIYEEYPDDDTVIDHELLESVYNASSIIKESGTLLFKAGRFRDAELKWRKCIRYVMEYIPDPDQEPEWFVKYNALRSKLYLNLSMVYLKKGEAAKAADFAEYLLDSDYPVLVPDKAKALFRQGNALIALRKYDDAIKALKEADKTVLGDKAIERELARAEGLKAEKKEKEKAKYSKFFN